MGDYIQVDFRFRSEEQKDRLVAQLDELGYEGFEEEAALLKAFIPRDAFDEALLEALAVGHGLDYAVSAIQETNWNQAWEAAFEPVLVDDFCAIRADFHPPADGVVHDIIITPKMSFGTGHHATTILMIEAMRICEISGKTVFDFGTGTGILAILAEKLGAASVVAIDTDEWSIRNGKENMQRNRCTKIEIYQSDSLPAAEFDLILANINRNVILANLEGMKDHIAAGGRILLSGMLADDGPDLLAAAQKTGLLVLSHQEKAGWISLLLAASR